LQEAITNTTGGELAEQGQGMAAIPASLFNSKGDKSVMAE